MKAALGALAGIVALALAGCGAISGNTADCPNAQQQLRQARSALAIAQIALTSAEAFGNVPAIALAQTAINTITADVAAIQTLVSQTCAVPPTPGVTMAIRAPAITLAEARKRAAADRKMAAALKPVGS